MAFFALDRCYRSVTRVLLPEYTPSRFPRRAFLATGRKWKTSTHPWRWPCWAFSNRVRESAPPSATSSSKRSTGTSSARCRAPHGGAKCAALLRSGSGVCIWHRSCPAEGNSFNPHTNAQTLPGGACFLSHHLKRGMDWYCTTLQYQSKTFSPESGADEVSTQKFFPGRHAASLLPGSHFEIRETLGSTALRDRLLPSPGSRYLPLGRHTRLLPPWREFHPDQETYFTNR
jgi:hypothetical protein